MEAHALRNRGWSISAIARHLNRDRKTIAAYLNGTRTPGVRRSRVVDPFEEFASYCRIRLAQDPHLLAMTLFDEVTALGYAGGYSTFTRAIRRRGLRPHCEPCRQAKGRDVAIIDHEPGAEVQWDWLHLPSPPPGWDWPHRQAYLLVGTLPYSGRWRGWLSPLMDGAHLVRGLHEVSVRLGGLPLSWRFDRMPTVVDRRTGQVLASFSAVAKYYGVAVAVCRPRRAQRKGAVERANDSAAQRWWRTLPDELSAEQAQRSLDEWCERRGDVRVRWAGGARCTVATVAAGEVLAAVPDRPYPALLEVDRIVSPQGLVGFEGNHYSVPPGYRDQRVAVRWRLDEQVVEIVSAAGNTLARHRLAVRGAHELVRTGEHVRALERVVLAAASDQRPPCRRKQRIPASPQALTEAARLRAARDGTGHSQATTQAAGSPGMAVVTDFAAYAAAARTLGPGRPADTGGEGDTGGDGGAGGGAGGDGGRQPQPVRTGRHTGRRESRP